MDDLMKRLEKEHGLSEDDSRGILATIKNYIKDRFPMVSGALDNFFPSGPQSNNEKQPPQKPTNPQSRQTDDFLE